MKNLGFKSSRLGSIAALAVFALLVLAWIDGGREPLRSITETVVLPGAEE